MSANIVEALSRQAAETVTRRGSLLTLGSALAAAVAAPSLAQAGNNKKQNRDQKKKKAKKKIDPIADQQAAEQAEQARQAELARQAENQANQVCANQVAACRTEVLSICQLPGGQCFAAAECCTSFSTCNTTAFFTCIVEVSN